MLPFRLGRYRHYKGNEYIVFNKAIREHDLKPVVLYYERRGSVTGPIWVRGLDDFQSLVPPRPGDIDDFYHAMSQPRFTLISEFPHAVVQNVYAEHHQSPWEQNKNPDPSKPPDSGSSSTSVNAPITNEKKEGKTREYQEFLGIARMSGPISRGVQYARARDHW